MRHILVSTVVLMFLGLIEPLSAQQEQAVTTTTNPSLPAGVSDSILSRAVTRTTGSVQEPRYAAPDQLRAQNGDWRSQDGEYAIAVAGQDISRRSPLDIALEAYRNAESDEGRDEAKAEIQKELGTQYDAFIDQQGKQVEELESRLAKLREQLQKRREAKSRMVELKLQMVISQAEGLGWPDQHQRGNAFYGQAIGPSGLQTLPGMYSPAQPEPPMESDRARSPRQPSEPRTFRGDR